MADRLGAGILGRSSGLGVLSRRGQGGGGGGGGGGGEVTLFEDVFDRPDAPSLGAPWLQAGAKPTIQISGNRAYHAPGSTFWVSTLNIGSMEGIEVEADAVTVDGGQRRAADIFIGANADTSSGIRLQRSSGTALANGWRIYEYASDIGTILAEGPSVAGDYSPALFRFRYKDGVFSGYYNDVLVVQYSGAHAPLGNYVAIAMGSLQAVYLERVTVRRV